MILKTIYTLFVVLSFAYHLFCGITHHLYAISLQFIDREENSFLNERQYKVSPDKRYEIAISKEGINRISVQNDRIEKIIGNEGDYTLHSDNVRGEVFFTNRLALGARSHITLVTEKGYVQDLCFHIVEMDPSTIVLNKMHKSSENHNKRREIIRQTDIKKEALQLIKYVMNEDSHYYSYRQLDNSYPIYEEMEKLGMSIASLSEYSNRIMKIYRFDYHHKPLNLGADFLLAKFPNAIAVLGEGNRLFLVFWI